jgi:hypothetical protein
MNAQSFKSSKQANGSFLPIYGGGASNLNKSTFSGEGEVI